MSGLEWIEFEPSLTDEQRKGARRAIRRQREARNERDARRLEAARQNQRVREGLTTTEGESEE